MGFSNWLFEANCNEINTEYLAIELSDYLDVVMSEGIDDPRSESAEKNGEILENFNENITSMGRIVAGIRRVSNGDEAMLHIANLATTPNPLEYIVTLSNREIEAVCSFIELFDEVCDELKTLEWREYLPGKMPILDNLLVHSIKKLDETLPLELSWDGIEPYRIFEVLAVTRLILDQKIRKDLLSQSMHNTIKKSSQVRVVSKMEMSRRTGVRV